MLTYLVPDHDGKSFVLIFRQFGLGRYSYQHAQHDLIPPFEEANAPAVRWDSNRIYFGFIFQYTENGKQERRTPCLELTLLF